MDVKKVKKVNKFDKKKATILAFIIVILVFGGLIVKKSFKRAPKQFYEVAVMVRGQSNKDPEEDRRTSLKAGDVLVVQKDGHNWSQTERVSYLILKMELNDEQKDMITRGVEKELTKEEIESQLNMFKEGREDIPEEELKQFEEELKSRRETTLMRAYRIDMSEFEGFTPNDLMAGQPYLDEVYGWGIVERK